MGVTDNELNWRGVRPLTGISGIWPAPNSTRVNASEAISDTGLVIVYTVPANKKLFISTVNLVTRNKAVQDAGHTVIVRNDTDVEQYKIVYHYHSTITGFASNHLFVIALEAAAGWDVVLTNTPDDTTARAFLFGWLEDA